MESRQDIINKKILDIIEDIVGLNSVYSFELGKKFQSLNLYVYDIKLPPKKRGEKGV